MSLYFIRLLSLKAEQESTSSCVSVCDKHNWQVKLCLSRKLDVRTNFADMYKNNLTCQLCLSHTDTQEEVLSCSALSDNNLMKYNDMFSDNLDTVVKNLRQFRFLWRKRESILLKQEQSSVHNCD
jgi:hypothetical protein